VKRFNLRRCHLEQGLTWSKLKLTPAPVRPTQVKTFLHLPGLVDTDHRSTGFTAPIERRAAIVTGRNDLALNTWIPNAIDDRHEPLKRLRVFVVFAGVQPRHRVRVRKMGTQAGRSIRACRTLELEIGRLQIVVMANPSKKVTADLDLSDLLIASTPPASRNGSLETKAQQLSNLVNAGLFHVARVAVEPHQIPPFGTTERGVTVPAGPLLSADLTPLLEEGGF
jgi:hypothetical protein